MNFNGWSNFEDFARACGYTKSNNENESTNEGCKDIPNGFQSLNPELFIIIGAILGDILAGNMPFNVQNALGNWLELVGQIILTYNAQQQYFQGGPGLYYNPKNYNINNPYCGPNSPTAPKPENAQSQTDKINELEARINSLMAEIELIKNKTND